MHRAVTLIAHAIVVSLLGRLVRFQGASSLPRLPKAQQGWSKLATDPTDGCIGRCLCWRFVFGRDMLSNSHGTGVADVLKNVSLRPSVPVAEPDFDLSAAPAGHATPREWLLLPADRPLVHVIDSPGRPTAGFEEQLKSKVRYELEVLVGAPAGKKRWPPRRESPRPRIRRVTADATRTHHLPWQARARCIGTPWRCWRRF